MFWSFFMTIFRGFSAVLCAITVPPADLRSLNSYYYAVCDLMSMSSVCVWFSCLLVICRSPTDKNTKHTYCVIIRTQRTRISGRNSNGTKHSGGPPEDGS